MELMFHDEVEFDIFLEDGLLKELLSLEVGFDIFLEGNGG